ncbi:hypothetical protein QR680_006042 [Steinernema hermaphroditum]|uniref:Nuclear receptor domain-containing protein n=1 Tax=Steinernema hermaphroditum TaxID=289476 RepID=A0AA39LWQ4_9BILA|nr:hypothetical protein QR680_006042 [Steinernema hermaphroditum]
MMAVTCVVCGGTAQGIHFRVNSCRACAAFFRRTAANSTKLKCRTATKACKVTSDEKFSCRYCRLAKCRKVGMVLSVSSTTPTTHAFAQQSSVLPMEHSGSEASTSLSPEDNISALPDLEFEDHKMKYDPSRILDEFKKIFNDDSNVLSPMACEAIAPTGMQSLLYAFLSLNPLVDPDTVMECEKIDVKVVIQHYESFLVRTARWAMCCVPFQQLLTADKWVVFRHVLPFFYALEKSRQAVHLFGKDPNDAHVMVTDNICADITKFHFESTSVDSADAKDFSEYTMEMFVSGYNGIIKPMKKLKLTDFEIVYLIGQIMWSLRREKDATPEVIEIGSRFVEQISNELHNYYVYELRLDNYAGRLARILRLQSELETLADIHHRKLLMSNVFHKYNIDFIDSILYANVE